MVAPASSSASQCISENLTAEVAEKALPLEPRRAFGGESAFQQLDYTFRFFFTVARVGAALFGGRLRFSGAFSATTGGGGDRKSTRLNSSHLVISYAVFCLKK